MERVNSSTSDAAQSDMAFCLELKVTELSRISTSSKAEAQGVSTGAEHPLNRLIALLSGAAEAVAQPVAAAVIAQTRLRPEMMLRRGRYCAVSERVSCSRRARTSTVVDQPLCPKSRVGFL